VSAATDILSRYQHIVRSLTFTTGSKGVFDVTVDGALIYSKAETGRHAEPGEVLDLFVEKYGQGVPLYGKE
jgi:selT/selW/selH-like putative selenoprotein